MSDLLAIGASGVSTYQTALTTVSENIANAGVAGYTRRKAVVSEVLVQNGLTLHPIRTGSGSIVSGIERQTDPLKEAAVRDTGADLARTQAGATWLDRVQSALTGDQLGDRLTSFFSAATTLAADPTSIAGRSTMLEAATSAAGAFTATGRALDQAATDLDSTADLATTQLDLLGQSLAKVNEGLGRAGTGTTSAAQLADQRDSMLDQMSAIANVNVSLDSLGRATVRLGDGTGPMFVQSSVSGAVTYVRNNSGAVSFAVHFNGATSALIPSGGALAGIADGAQKIQDATDALDSLATDFTTSVNNFQTSGADLDGNPGVAMFATGGAPTEISLAMTNPRGVAAASPTGGSRDGSNLDALQTVRTTTKFESRLTDLVSSNAAQIAQRQTVADAQTTIRDGAVTARDAVGGVNLDTEAVDLLRFQQAYSASSRVIQAARDTFQSILDIR